MVNKLPYIFDLLWDVKTYEQVERIAKFEATCSDANPYDLVELFQQENLEIPECLKGFVQKDDSLYWDKAWKDMLKEAMVHNMTSYLKAFEFKSFYEFRKAMVGYSVSAWTASEASK